MLPIAPSKTTSFLELRYRHTRCPETYGRVVYHHLNGIRKRMVQEQPVRQSFLKLIKDVSDLLHMIRNSEATLARQAQHEDA